jgi:AcrR family transcriptional regulator
MDEMAGEERQLRADAERNRRRLLDAAATLFAERGLEVSVGDIAERAGVGRGTLFRNFPTKEHLIAAIVVERLNEASERGAELLGTDDPGDTLFRFVQEAFGVQQRDRALFESVADEFLANEHIRAAYERFVHTFDQLLQRAQDAGAVRRDVGTMDVLMLTKGVCQAALSFQQLDPEIAERQFDLVRAALAPSAATLRGRRATLEDLERAHAADPPGQAAIS